ncbi:hypothetical protein [Streptomyces bacillaris]|uniref:hypothetical protein n=1 Tax=Streptomyces bacillaris TaxID=68179 RepID=UPI00345F4026
MTTQPGRVHHLLDRLLRGVLLPEEAEQLAGAVRELERQVEDQATADQVANRAAMAITAMGTDVREARTERDRYRLAWQSARTRAKRAKRNRESELRWANGMWSDALRDLHRYRQAWTSARRRAQVARLTPGTTP